MEADEFWLAPDEEDSSDYEEDLTLGCSMKPVVVEESLLLLKLKDLAFNYNKSFDSSF